MDKIDLDIPEVRLDLPKDWDNLDLLDLKVEQWEVLLDNIDIELKPIDIVLEPIEVNLDTLDIELDNFNDLNTKEFLNNFNELGGNLNGFN